MTITHIRSSLGSSSGRKYTDAKRPRIRICVRYNLYKKCMIIKQAIVERKNKKINETKGKKIWRIKELTWGSFGTMTGLVRSNHDDEMITVSLQDEPTRIDLASSFGAARFSTTYTKHNLNLNPLHNDSRLEILLNLFCFAHMNAHNITLFLSDYVPHGCIIATH